MDAYWAGSYTAWPWCLMQKGGKELQVVEPKVSNYPRRPEVQTIHHFQVNRMPVPKQQGLGCLMQEVLL